MAHQPQPLEVETKAGAAGTPKSDVNADFGAERGVRYTVMTEDVELTEDLYTWIFRSPMFMGFVVFKLSLQRFDQLQPVWRLNTTTNSTTSPADYYLDDPLCEPAFETRVTQGILFVLICVMVFSEVSNAMNLCCIRRAAPAYGLCPDYRLVAGANDTPALTARRRPTVNDAALFMVNFARCALAAAVAFSSFVLLLRECALFDSIVDGLALVFILEVDDMVYPLLKSFAGADAHPQLQQQMQVVVRSRPDPGPDADCTERNPCCRAVFRFVDRTPFSSMVAYLVTALVIVVPVVVLIVGLIPGDNPGRQ